MGLTFFDYTYIWPLSHDDTCIAIQDPTNFVASCQSFVLITSSCLRNMRFLMKAFFRHLPFIGMIGITFIPHDGKFCITIINVSLSSTALSMLNSSMYTNCDERTEQYCSWFVSMFRQPPARKGSHRHTENQYRDTVSHENRRLNASISNTYIIGHLSSCERGLRLILTIRLAGSRQSSVSCLPEHSSISFARSHCRPAFHMTFSILGKNVLTGSANLCNTVWTDPRWSPVFRRQN